MRINAKHSGSSPDAPPPLKKLYRAWTSIMQAGKRGERVHHEWVQGNNVGFSTFKEHVGLPPTMTAKLLRKRRKLGYVPNNIAWRVQGADGKVPSPSPRKAIIPPKWRDYYVKVSEIDYRHAVELTEADHEPHSDEWNEMLIRQAAERDAFVLKHKPAEEDGSLRYDSNTVERALSTISYGVTDKKRPKAVSPTEHPSTGLYGPKIREVHGTTDDPLHRPVISNITKKEEPEYTGDEPVHVFTAPDALREGDLFSNFPDLQYKHVVLSRGPNPTEPLYPAITKIPSPNELRSMDRDQLQQLVTMIYGEADEIRDIIGRVDRDDEEVPVDKWNRGIMWGTGVEAKYRAARIFNVGDGTLIAPLEERLARAEARSNRLAADMRRFHAEFWDTTRLRARYGRAEKLRRELTTQRSEYMNVIYKIRKQYMRIEAALRTAATPIENLIHDMDRAAQKQYVEPEQPADAGNPATGTGHDVLEDMFGD